MSPCPFLLVLLLLLVPGLVAAACPPDGTPVTVDTHDLGVREGNWAVTTESGTRHTADGARQTAHGTRQTWLVVWRAGTWCN